MDINRLFEILRQHKEDQIHIDQNEINAAWENFANQLPKSSNTTSDNINVIKSKNSFIKGFSSAVAITVLLGVIYFIMISDNQKNDIKSEQKNSIKSLQSSKTNIEEIAEENLDKNENEKINQAINIDASDSKTSLSFENNRNENSFVNSYKFDNSNKNNFSNKGLNQNSSIRDLQKNIPDQTLTNIINNKFDVEDYSMTTPDALTNNIGEIQSSNTLTTFPNNTTESGEGLSEIASVSINVEKLDKLPSINRGLQSEEKSDFSEPSVIILPNSSMPKFYIATEGSYYSLHNSYQTGFRLLVGFNINRKLSLLTGGGIGLLSGNYKMVPHGWPPLINPKPLKNISTITQLFELPLEVRYNILHKKYLNIYIGSKIACIFKNNEKGFYKFERPGFPEEESVVIFNKRNLVQYGFSIGAEYQVSENFNIYASANFANQILRSKDKVMSPGVNIGLKYNL